MQSIIRTFGFVSVAVLLCSGAGSACAAALPRYGVIVYSNFCVSEASRDLYGDRITLHRFADGDTLIYEYTDGSTHALIGTDLKLDPQSATLSFNADVSGDRLATVSGTLSRDGRYLAVQGLPFKGDTKVSLTRIANAAAPIRACKALQQGTSDRG